MLNDLLRQSVVSESLDMVLERAVEVIGDRERAYSWFGRPVKALKGATPISMLSTPDGVQQVLTVLGRLEHGVF
jgi:putative toxin-antitoxin system antitoxin component (TIGR02293 family)